jgi:hypothetical protein
MQVPPKIATTMDIYSHVSTRKTRVAANDLRRALS